MLVSHSVICLLLKIFVEPSHLEPLLRHFLSMIRVLILRLVPSDALVLVSSSRPVFSRLLALLLIVFSCLLVLILRRLAIICTITDLRCHVFMRRLLCKFPFRWLLHFSRSEESLTFQRFRSDVTRIHIGLNSGHRSLFRCSNACFCISFTSSDRSGYLVLLSFQVNCSPIKRCSC